jgi:hypothetical protein
MCRKRVSGTKMSNFDNCEKSEEQHEVRGLIDGECSFGTMRNTPRFAETSFRFVSRRGLRYTRC